MKKTKIGILGMARSGIAAARKAIKLGADVFISEFKTADSFENFQQLSEEFNCEFGGHSDEILKSEFIILSPGIPSDIPILLEAKSLGIEVISEIEYGYRIKAKDSEIIAVTGSNGKSTTVTLIYNMLKEEGQNVILAGNIGDAFTSFPIEEAGIDFIVLELSSFQLENIKDFHANVAVLLNVSPDHLDRYKSFDDYGLTKFNIFKNQTENDIAVLNYQDKFIRKYDHLINSKKVYFSLNRSDKTKAYYSRKGEYLVYDCLDAQGSKMAYQLRNLKLKGPHNLQNILSAILVLGELKLFSPSASQAITLFTGLEHRLEYVEEINGVKFYNDSKATNSDSVKSALKSFSEPLHLIMGGSLKKEDYSVLKELIQENVKKIYLIGESKKILKETFEDIVDIEEFSEFKDAVLEAQKNSQPGDIVLLSPACASYDMFKNFEERGKYFKSIVEEIKNVKK